MKNNDLVKVLNYNDDVYAFVDGLYVIADIPCNLIDHTLELLEHFEFEVIEKNYHEPDNLYILKIRKLC